ncbi:hypothetical protein CMEL01_07129 [Colletotrichum melonis]|uniref:Secreted protein n=1 Tax=Colletotrichum melonis TaxID=1209925 RepID=A0AAI9XHM1_9PEZI|nr:hypothetical protein CMEL01_07129 [Colletotrichum melonis]
MGYKCCAVLCSLAVILLLLFPCLLMEPPFQSPHSGVDSGCRRILRETGMSRHHSQSSFPPQPHCTGPGMCWCRSISKPQNTSIAHWLCFGSAPFGKAADWLYFLYLSMSRIELGVEDK